MKLALVILGPLDRRSGGYSYDLDWRDHLAGLGQEVEVWSLPGTGSAAGEALAQRFAGAQPDLVVFDGLVHSAVEPWLESHSDAKRCPWVALVHHLAWLEDPQPTPDTPTKQRLEQQFLDRMDAFLFNSEDTRDSVALLRGPGTPFRPSLVNRPPLPLKPVSPRTPDPSRPAGLLFLANLTPRKNLHGLLSALGVLLRRRPQLEWRLTVAGNPDFDSEYTQRCRALADAEGLGQRVDWAGWVDDTALEALWSRTDVLAVPSFHEGWGMVYAEALVRGVVPLCGCRGGGPEAVGSAGLRVNPGSPAEIAEALEAFLTTADRKAASLRARRRGEWLAGGGTGFAGLEEFLASLVPATAEGPAEPSFDAYLEAKASVDTKSLHPGVLEAAFSGVEIRRVLELGGGTGTMARRLRTAGRIGARTRYEIVDQAAGSLEVARARGAPLFDPGFLVTRTADVRDVLDCGAEAEAPDLVVAHAVLDLFDPYPTALGLARLGARRYWLTHIFDGLTAWEPLVDPELDEAIIRAYHRSMDERALVGEGSSRSGRDWLAALPAAGLDVMAAASSDWVVRPRHGHYPEDEAVFLRGILGFFRSSLTGRRDVDQAGLAWWLTRRHRQVDLGEATFLAHQLDLAAQRP